VLIFQLFDMFPDLTRNVNSRTSVFRISNEPFFFYSGRQGRDAASQSNWFVVVITGVAKKVNAVSFPSFLVCRVM
jgi:hypothetical protein